jgi:hypothetical protein
MDAQSIIEFPADETAGSAEVHHGTPEETKTAPAKLADDPSTPSVAAEKPPVVESTRPVSEATAAESTASASRTLKLEPIVAESAPADSIATGSMVKQDGPRYVPVPESVDTKTQGDASSLQVTTVSRPVLHFGPATQDAAHRTNVADQVSMAIKSFDVSDVPLNRVLDMLANMAAVPISVDPVVLSAADVSLDTKVAVHAHDLTLGKILGGVLREHNLACEVRDGQLVIIGRPGDASASTR